MSSSSQPEDEAPWPDQRYAWFVVIVLYLGAVLSLMDRQIISLLVGDIKQHLGLTDFEIGLLQGPPFGIFYALMSIPIALLAYRGNLRNIIVLTIFVEHIIIGIKIVIALIIPDVPFKVQEDEMKREKI